LYYILFKTPDTFIHEGRYISYPPNPLPFKREGGGKQRGGLCPPLLTLFPLSKIGERVHPEGKKGVRLRKKGGIYYGNIRTAYWEVSAVSAP
jgi:hypothetical protein